MFKTSPSIVQKITKKFKKKRVKIRKKINKTDVIFPMPVLMIATYNEDGSVDVMN